MDFSDLIKQAKQKEMQTKLKRVKLFISKPLLGFTT